MVRINRTLLTEVISRRLMRARLSQNCQDSAGVNGEAIARTFIAKMSCKATPASQGKNQTAERGRGNPFVLSLLQSEQPRHFVEACEPVSETK